MQVSITHGPSQILRRPIPVSYWRLISFSTSVTYWVFVSCHNVSVCIKCQSVLIVIGLQRRCNWSSNRLQQRRSSVVDVQQVSVLKEPVGRTDAYNPRRNHIAPIMASVIACRRPTVPALCSLSWPTGDQHLLGLWHYAEYANAAVARVTLHTYRHTSMCS